MWMILKTQNINNQILIKIKKKGNHSFEGLVFHIIILYIKIDGTQLCFNMLFMFQRETFVGNTYLEGKASVWHTN